MSDLTITHDHADGTVLSGDPRPHQEILKRHGWRYSRNVGWYVPRSRDSSPDTAKIAATREGLEGCGLTVDVEIDDERRSMEDREADRTARSESRSEHLSGKAERLSAEADARIAKAHEISDMIPFGQPILVGHHSEARHRAAHAKIESNYDKGFAAFREAERVARAAVAAKVRQEARLGAPQTLRRVDRLETESRRIVRMLEDPHSGSTLDDDANTAWRERMGIRVAEIDEEVTFWRQHLADLEDAGVKLWSAADFAKGDRVQTRAGAATVRRVNVKSLSCEWDVMPGIVRPCPYNKVVGKLDPIGGA